MSTRADSIAATRRLRLLDRHLRIGDHYVATGKSVPPQLVEELDALRWAIGVLYAVTSDERWSQAIAHCGDGGVGCREPIATVAELYRCADCKTPMHRECLRLHFRNAQAEEKGENHGQKAEG